MDLIDWHRSHAASEYCRNTGEDQRYCKTLGLSHYELAQKVGAAPCTIIGWENDRVRNVEKKDQTVSGWFSRVRLDKLSQPNTKKPRENSRGFRGGGGTRAQIAISG